MEENERKMGNMFGQETGYRETMTLFPAPCPHYLVLVNVAVKSSEVVNVLPLTVKSISQL
jgi:hypothetical protein